jgi:hypothetical protein
MKSVKASGSDRSPLLAYASCGRTTQPTPADTTISRNLSQKNDLPLPEPARTSKETVGKEIIGNGWCLISEPRVVPTHPVDIWSLPPSHSFPSPHAPPSPPLRYISLLLAFAHTHTAGWMERAAVLPTTTTRAAVFQHSRDDSKAPTSSNSNHTHSTSYKRLHAFSH